EAEPPERPQRGPLVRRQHGLPHAQRGHEAHLSQSLQRRRPRIGRLPRVRQRSDVAVRQPRVVVGRPHQAVEVVLARGHRGPSYLEKQKPRSARGFAQSTRWRGSLLVLAAGSLPGRGLPLILLLEQLVVAAFLLVL